MHRTTLGIGVLLCLTLQLRGDDSCATSRFGCCPDGVTAALDEVGTDCPQGEPGQAVPAGIDIQLTCELPDVPHILSWKFIPMNKSVALVPPTSSRFETSVSGNSSFLSISGIQLQDSGTYVCEANLTETGEITTNHVVIRVTDQLDISGVETTEAVFVTEPFHTGIGQSSTLPEELFETTLFATDPPDDRLNLPDPPAGLKVKAISEVSSDQTVEVEISWELPSPDAVVELYTIYYSGNKSLPMWQWSSGDIMETSMISRVKTQYPTYFRVAAVNSRSMSPLSDIIVFYIEKEREKVDSSKPEVQAEVKAAPDAVVVKPFPSLSSNAPTSTTTEVLPTFPNKTVEEVIDPQPMPEVPANASDVSTSARHQTTTAIDVLSAVANSSHDLAAILSKQDAVDLQTANQDLSTADSIMAKPGSKGADCKTTKYGCCADGLTAAGPSQQGCGGKLPAPRNFLIERTVVGSDRVAIHLSWDQLILPSNIPAAEYTFRFTDDREMDVGAWRAFTVPDTEYDLALRTGHIYYFGIVGVTGDGVETESSALYKYDPTELKSSRCVDNECTAKACHISRYGCCEDGVTEAVGPRGYGCPKKEGCMFSPWGCCTDGVSIAAGPNRLGCSGDPQPCDVSPYQCCPDGVTEAMGENFKGCPESIQTTAGAPLGHHCFTGQDGQRKCKELTTLADSCLLPKEEGSCANYTINWYFDVSSGACRRFWYGGCEGNTNRFSSQDHCESVCVSPPGTAACYLPAVTGRCDDLSTRWHYDHRLRSCQQFEYGGCLGNNNNFVSEIDCLQFCEPKADGQRDACSLPMERGGCRGSYPRWGYNSRTGSCEAFDYSGCQGNDNRFVTREFCEQRCKPDLVQEDVCTQVKDTGPCLSLIPSWYYDMARDTCSPFYYGGCGGGSNRFTSQQICEKTCRDKQPAVEPGKCLQPVVVGSCSDYLTRYAYHPSDSSCRPFVYTGCHGNENNFHTQTICEIACAPAYERDADRLCMLPEDAGECAGGSNSLQLSRWRYDQTSSSCVQFVYSGCRGNSNNFLSREDCLRSCDEKSAVKGHCSLDVDEGEKCAGEFPRWYYDSSSRSCLPFTYGGCAGNSNRFMSERSCMAECGIVGNVTEKDDRNVLEQIHRCAEAKHAGHACAGDSKPMISWFYDRREGSCQQFTYAGCGGNGNRFSSKDECGQICSADNVCSLPAEDGSCDRSLMMYTYDVGSHECVQFMYSGCGGNANRFETRAMCEVACLRYMVDQQHIVPTETAQCQVEITCYNSCPDGYLKDRRGCSTCQCVDLCQPVECPVVGTHCVVQRKNCADNSTLHCLTTAQPVCIENGASQDTPPYITRPDGQGSQYVIVGGAAVTLFCNAYGSPAPSVVWYKHRRPLVVGRRTRYRVGDDHSLTIVNVQAEDEAEYICRAFNRVGEPAYEYLTLTVHEGVLMKAGPVEFISSRGSNVRIPCEVTGSPKPEILWMNRGVLLSPGSKYHIRKDNSLVVHNVISSDAGDYVCIARNRYNSASKTLTLKIKEALRASLQDHNTTYVEGDNLTLACLAEGFPPAKIEWLRNDETLPYKSRIVITAHTLQISNLVEDDAGFYTCIASNEHEALSLTTSISIKPGIDSLPDSCTDRKELANCELIVTYGYCSHRMYSRICCRSCEIARRLGR